MGMNCKLLVTLAAALLLTSVSANAAEPSDVAAQVASILSRRCVSCHGGTTKQEGDLALDTLVAMTAGGEGGAAIVPGEPDESLLIEYVSGDEPEMPQDADPLSAAEVKVLRDWITAGAKWPDGLVVVDASRPDNDWWSLKQLTAPAVPSLPDADRGWARTPIDAFIATKLREQGLHPSDEADRRTLIRRLYFDLLGLPPNPEEVRAFVANEHPLAYEHLVDRLLASPHYGERWGRHWLDVVHYGDTHGYDKDKVRRNAWPYRDYVIRSFNGDKPYRRFVQEQLAGDVLFADDPDGIVATGFIAAGPWDFVGHVELREGTLDKKITRNLDRDDMVSTAMWTFNSVTIHCARCHDHKFDPITQKDYYRLQSVFAGVERADRPYVVDRDQHRQRTQLAAEIERLENEHRGIGAKMRDVAAKNPQIAKLDKQLAAANAELSKLPAIKGTSPSNGYHSLISAKADVTKWVQVDLGEATNIDGVRLLPARPTDFPDSPGFGFPARFKIETSLRADFKSDVNVLADHTRADYKNPGDTPMIVSGSPQQARYVRVTATRLWKRSNDFVFALAELQVMADGENRAAGKTVTALDSINSGRWNHKHLVDGFTSRRSLVGSGDDSEVIAKRESLTDLIAKLAAERKTIADSMVGSEIKERIKTIDTSLAKSQEQLAALPKSPVVYAAAASFAPQGSFRPAPNGQPRPIHLLARGEVKNPQQLMEPGSLACITDLESDFQLASDAGEGARRSKLARWITDDRNPLTWRSIANRVWQYHFGRGIVDTPSDFGRMGSLPTHPELLDYLAVQVRDGDGSLKRIHRQIVTSAVYRQSSRADEQRSKIDSGNRYLWRQNRRRLEAEAVRDAVLSVTDSMDSRMYGPGYFLFGFKDDHSPHYLYEDHDVDDAQTLRRTVYRFVVRSVPDPLMETLDCADPSSSVSVRNTTLTALQALALLNNPLLVRQSEHFATRVQSESDAIDDQIRTAYQLAFARDPSAAEQRLMRAYAQKHGLANMCRLLLNTNEFVFID